jgi:hypothetical protein
MECAASMDSMEAIEFIDFQMMLNQAFFQFLTNDDLPSCFNLVDYAKLSCAIPYVSRSCPPCCNFVSFSKCHGLTNCGKQCSLNPATKFENGVHLCRNHINKMNTLIIWKDMKLKVKSRLPDMQEDAPAQYDFPAGAHAHIHSYFQAVEQLLPWNDKIKQMAHQFKEFSTVAAQFMPADMFISDPALGIIGRDIKVASAFLFSLRCKQGPLSVENVRKVSTLKNMWSQTKAGLKPHHQIIQTSSNLRTECVTSALLIIGLLPTSIFTIDYYRH